jgi:predicted ATPase/GAF domain-containing protein/anti-anti-sigma regulatory factor/tRNA A-37 threonylcarbamoyl transferase component Bud32
MVSESSTVPAGLPEILASAVVLHEGAETVVYRGRAGDARVVVKATRREYPTAKELARLRREFTILRELDLPRTPRALRLEPSGRGLALVMADIGHPTLRAILDARRLDVGAALSLAVALSDVLAAVHGRGVVHKDVTPQNILVEEETLGVYLIDFGIAARAAPEAQGQAEADAAEGTLAYMAPEQTGRMSRPVDLRADLYALGAVLYEALTGEPPFAAESAAELIHHHLARQATPPHERAPGVPEQVSRIVMTLLAKAPEDRYQSDAGLRADLAACLEAWRATGRVEPFPLRRFDRAAEIRRSRALYGREREILWLSEAFERARLRGPELVTVSGEPGVGKSALLGRAREILTGEGGRVVAGGFDPVSQGVPLAPLVQALRELVRQVLTEPPRSLARWRAELTQAIGQGGRLISDLVPELELVVGPQPEAPALPPDQAKNRFEATLQGFLRAFASPERPLAIFLDDLQWADPASIKLLSLLLSEGYVEHVLLVVAYRGGEGEAGVGAGTGAGVSADAGAARLPAIEALRREGLSAAAIHLGPLDPEGARSVVAEALSIRAEDASELAELAFEKTRGNPFFMYQFLAAQRAAGLLRFDAAAGAWRWDAERIKGAGVTENVVDLLVGELRSLSPAAQEVLLLASCVGPTFDVRALSAAGGRTVEDTAADLGEARRTGLVVPRGGGEEAPGAPPDQGARFRFLHDRIRETAYSLVEPGRRPAIHLAIGRLLWRRGEADPCRGALLDVVRHLNLGAGEMTDAEERLELARLNLRAGRQARGATAHKAASDYFSAGAALLREEDWERERDLCFALYVEGAECAYLDGDADRAGALLGAVLPRTASAVERAPIVRMRVRVLYSLAQSEEAVKVGGEGLVELGYPWSLEEARSKGAIAAELAKVQVSLGGRRVEDLVGAEEPLDPTIRAIQGILEAMMLPAYRLGQVFMVVALRGTSFALEHGHSDVSSYLYATCAFLFTLLLGRAEEGAAFLRLALALYERRPNVMMRARIDLCAACCGPMAGPVRAAALHFAAARRAGLAAGDLDMMGLTCALEALARLGAGDQLEDVLERADKNLDLVRRTRSPRIVLMTVARQAVAALLGRTEGPTSLGDNDVDEGRLRARVEEPGQGTAAFHYHALKLQLHLLFGELDAAMEAGDAAELRASAVAGMLDTLTLPFYRCLVLLALPEAEAPLEAERRADVLRRSRGRLDALAAASPEAFLARKVLVDAEAARAAGDTDLALRLYDEAVSLAQGERAPQIEAMALERSGELLLRIGAKRAAGAALRSAILAYAHWGAARKVEAMEAEHAGSLATTSVDATTSRAAVLSRATVTGLRDAALVFRAVQTIASEVDLPVVIERLAALVLESAGAQRGALILEREGDLFVSAVFGEGAAALREQEEARLSEADGVAQAVVLYVVRTQEAVVLDAPFTGSRFADDPRVLRGEAKALLCLPLLYQGRVIGALYLENGAAPGVFNAARVELLALLSSQAAIAIANARLISSVRAAAVEVTRANERLEGEVASRTRDLAAMNEDLALAKGRLELELARLAEAERERGALQAQVIEAQRARLAEMSTPVLPITKGVLVMPIVGSVDRERAEDILAAALSGAQRSRARVMILDVTGMKLIDAGAVQSLIGVASALRLLGTEAVVTGIAPRVAQTLVTLGVDLSSFVTMGTLEAGVSYALGAQAPRAGRRLAG